MFQDREEVKLPEARIERRLKFFYKFSIPVLETAGPFVQHVAIEPVGLFPDAPKIRVLRFFTNHWREQVHGIYPRLAASQRVTRASAALLAADKNPALNEVRDIALRGVL